MSGKPVQNYYQCPNCASPIHRRRKTCRRCGWGRPLSHHIPERIRTSQRKILGVGYRVYRWSGRPCAPCPDCNEQIPKRSRRCRFCGWEGGYRTIVRPTLRHFLLRLINFNLRRSRETVPCPHCQWAMPAQARRCPLCMRSPEVDIPEPLLLIRPWLHLRRLWVRWAVRDAMMCPECSVQVPPWAPGCLCCGWERPRAGGKIATMRYAFEEVKGEVRERFRPSEEPPAGDICPECDVVIPLSDRRCMICGWAPDRKKTMLDAAGFLLEEIKQRNAVESDLDLNACKVCQVPMSPRARMCLVCGWAPPVKNPVLRYMRKTRVRKFRKYGPTWRPCPNCRVPLTRHAVKCMACGWEKSPTRYWGKSPRALWLTLSLLVVCGYFAFQFLVVMAAGGSGMDPLVDEYGRDRFEKRKVPTAPLPPPSLTP